MSEAEVEADIVTNHVSIREIDLTTLITVTTFITLITTFLVFFFFFFITSPLFHPSRLLYPQIPQAILLHFPLRDLPLHICHLSCMKRKWFLDLGSVLQRFVHRNRNWNAGMNLDCFYYFNSGGDKDFVKLYTSRIYLFRNRTNLGIY